MILDLFLIGVGITIEPLPITAFILILGAENGVRKGRAFLAGWVVSLAVVIVAAVLVTGGKPLQPASTPSTFALIVKLLIGVLLIFTGLRRRSHRDRPRKPPTWMTKLDGLSGWTAAGLAVILQPWALIAAGAATVVEAKVASVEEYLVLILFGLLSSSSLLIMEIYATARPEAAGLRLERIKIWMDTHREQAIIAIALLLGMWLVGKSLYGLVSA